jgi:hypothetical protein
MLGRAFSVTSNSRMMYAFSRDGAIPGSKFLHKVDHRWRSPIRAGLSFHDSTPELGIAEALTRRIIVCLHNSLARVRVEFHPRLAQFR